MLKSLIRRNCAKISLVLRRKVRRQLKRMTIIEQRQRIQVLENLSQNFPRSLFGVVANSLVVLREKSRTSTSPEQTNAISIAVVHSTLLSDSSKTLQSHVLLLTRSWGNDPQVVGNHRNKFHRNGRLTVWMLFFVLCKCSCIRRTLKVDTVENLEEKAHHAI